MVRGVVSGRRAREEHRSRADHKANSHLSEFWKAHPLETAGKSALVIGSGFGEDAEEIAGWGFQTTGFDIAKTAIAAAKKRFPIRR